MSPGPEHLEIGVGQLMFDALAEGPAGGELVLLLHGFPQSSHEWRSQLDALGAAGYRAVAPDQRGYSPRARPAGVEHYRAEPLVADVVGMADRLGAFGGTLDVRSQPGDGTTITGTLPTPPPTGSGESAAP